MRERLSTHRMEPEGDELSRLVSAWIDGELDASAVATLESRLLTDPAARRAVIDALFLDVQLAEELSATGLVGMIDALAPQAAGGKRQPAAAPSGSAMRGLSRFAAAIAVAVLVATVGGLVANWQAVRASVGGAARNAVAEISRTRLAMPPSATDGATQPLTRGRVLGRGRVEIASGAMELAIVNGVMMVLEGPAVIELIDVDRAFLHRGVAVIRMPQAVDEFSLETATTRVVIGGGGECAAKVDASLTTDVQVYVGDALVSAGSKHGGGQYPDRVVAGEALRVSSQADAAPERIAFSANRFTRRVPDDTKGIGLGAIDKNSLKKIDVARHAAIVVTRAPGAVTVDGDLGEWPTKPGFRRTRRGGDNEAEWLEGWMMHDEQHLYVAARVGDPLPLRNSVDHDLDPGLAWQGGGLQLFFSGDRATGWPADANGPGYFGNRNLAAPFAERAKSENPRLMTLLMTHQAPSGVDRLLIGKSVSQFRPERVAADAFAGRFRRSSDGRGYTIEYAIPWATLGLADDPPRAGDDLAVAWELHYSDETGKLWRDQIIEIRNPAEPADIYLFERAATWGRAEFR